jgi:hypothetical protein
MRHALAVAVGLVAVATAGSAFAGKVNIPKEGSYEFNFCSVGETRIMTSGDTVFVNQYKVIANLLTQPPGKAFDRMSSLCYGVYAKLNGRSQEFGVCELTDVDGDQWWMEYHGNAEGSGGSYTAAHGTGKYDGMGLKGQYILDFWPNAVKDGVQACNQNKGTYKLK